MKLYSFKNGVHPCDGKELSMNSAIREISAATEMVYPLSQHIGAPSVPLVKAGDSVLLGQKIAEAGSFMSAPVFSSVSGTVKAIEPRTTVVGETVSSIVIINDGKYTPAPGFGEKRDYESLTAAEIREIIKNSGIVGLGGAGFPTHVKLTPKDDNAIEYLIIDGAECEPYLTSDYRLMLERPEAIIEGAKVVLKLFPKAKCRIGIEQNKPQAIKLLSEKVRNENRIEICTLKTKYPQGGERMMIHALTGRDIASKNLPFEAGCIVMNTASVVAVADAVCRSTPLIKRVMTVTGDAVKNPCNLLVPLGISHKAVLDAAGGFCTEPKKIISGGPMMGIAIFTLDIPVIKTSSSILALKNDDMEKFPTTPCIHCGRCVTACPENLIPQMMMRASDNNDLGSFEELHGMECIECGSCAYACPTGQPLTQSFRFAKKAITANRKKQSK